MWAPVARDGVFILRNVASNSLLAASATRQDHIDTMPATARDDSACHWRLLDTTTSAHIRVFYDSGLTIMPSELGGAPSATLSAPMPLELKTGTASPEMRAAMVQSFAQEHDAIRSLLS